MINLTKRGKVFHANATIGRVRLRGSLGTINEKSAKQLANRIEVALFSGNKDVWEGLKLVLPEATYQTFSEGKVVEPLRVGKMATDFGFKLFRRRELGEISPGTYTRYLGVADEFFWWLTNLKNVQLMDEITPTMIEEYRTYRLAHTLRRKQSRGGQGLDVDVVVLKQIFDLAIELGYSKPNPVKSIYRTKVRPSKVPQPYAIEELDKLQTAAYAESELATLVVMLLRYTGMRGSDVAGLTWAEVDFENKVIRRKTIKRGTEVVVPLNNLLLSQLKNAATSDIKDHAHVLEETTRPQIYTLVQRLGKKAGVANPRPHRFRSSLATGLLAKGTNIHDVALLLGDSVSVIESHYCGHKEASVERVRSIMDAE